MSERSLQDLENAARKISANETEETRRQALAHAYSLFAAETNRIGKDCESLQTRFQKIKKQLHSVNGELRQKVVELDIAAWYINNILSQIPQGLIFISSGGIVTTYNPMAEKILGVDRPRVLFQPFWDAFEDKIFGFSIREALKTRTAPSIEHATLPPFEMNKEPKKIIVETSFTVKDPEKTKGLNPSPLFDLAKGIIVVIRDVSHSQKLETQTDQNTCMQEFGETISLISHEIRNPLGGIKGYAALLAEEVKDDPNKKRMADKLSAGIDTLHRTLDRIVDYSRPFEVHPAMTDLGKLIQEVADHTKLNGEAEKNITVTVNLPSERICAPIEPALVKSALFNLAANAVYAMPDGGKLIFSLKRTDSEAVIRVEDTGNGIPKESRDKIFRLFFSTKPKGKGTGTGIGLAECSRIILSHHGSLTVDSEEDKGSAFTIKLPLKQE